MCLFLFFKLFVRIWCKCISSLINYIYLLKNKNPIKTRNQANNKSILFLFQNILFFFMIKTILFLREDLILLLKSDIFMFPIWVKKKLIQARANRIDTKNQNIKYKSELLIVNLTWNQTVRSRVTFVYFSKLRVERLFRLLD